MVADGGEGGTSCRPGCDVHLMCIDLPCLEALFGDPEVDIPGLVLLCASLCVKATDFLRLGSFCSQLTVIIDFHHFLSGTRIMKPVG